jgi:8-oxo-dGTP pyrophosphatase MutT (NUDIX family)
VKPNAIRPIAICVFQHDGHILAAEFYDPIKQQPFYRPLGGAIEFGEHSAATLARELQEELGAAVTDLRYLGTLENVFTYNGQRGHEIVMVYDGAFVDHSLYEQSWLDGVEDSGAPFRAVWLALADCRHPAAPPVYPTGLLELLEKSDAETQRTPSSGF